MGKKLELTYYEHQEVVHKRWRTMNWSGFILGLLFIIAAVWVWYEPTSTKLAVTGVVLLFASAISAVIYDERG